MSFPISKVPTHLLLDMRNRCRAVQGVIERVGCVACGNTCDHVVVVEDHRMHMHIKHDQPTDPKHGFATGDAHLDGECRRDSYYAKTDYTCITLTDILKELPTREHLPTKKERKEIRQQKALERKNR